MNYVFKKYSNIQTMKQTLIFFIAILLISCCSTQKNTKENNSADSKEKKDTLMKNESNPYLKLEPGYEILDESRIKFTLKATRLAVREEEYIPNSQTFRVIVNSLKGKTVWDSGGDKNFMQMVMPVLPEAVDETYTYEIIWDRWDQTSIEPPPKAEYTVTMIIPAKPREYSSTISISINFRK